MRNKKSLDFLGIQAKVLGLQRYLVMCLRESRSYVREEQVACLFGVVQ